MKGQVQLYKKKQIFFVYGAAVDVKSLWNRWKLVVGMSSAESGRSQMEQVLLQSLCAVRRLG